MNKQKGVSSFLTILLGASVIVAALFFVYQDKIYDFGTGTLDSSNLPVSQDEKSSEEASQGFGGDEDKELFIRAHDKLGSGMLTMLQPVEESMFNKFIFAKDDKNVYYLGYSLNRTVQVLDQADPNTFVLLNSVYAKDKNNVFVEMRDEFGSDKNSQAFGPLIGADPASFEIVQSFLSKDKNRVYTYQKTLEGADASTFRHYSQSEYFIDKDSVFGAGGGLSIYVKLLGDGVDTAAFRELGDYGIYLDNKNVYVDGVAISDLNTSKVTYEPAKKQDAQSYIHGTITDGTKSYVLKNFECGGFACRMPEAE